MPGGFPADHYPKKTQGSPSCISESFDKGGPLYRPQSGCETSENKWSTVYCSLNHLQVTVHSSADSIPTLLLVVPAHPTIENNKDLLEAFDNSWHYTGSIGLALFNGAPPAQGDVYPLYLIILYLHETYLYIAFTEFDCWVFLQGFMNFWISFTVSFVGGFVEDRILEHLAVRRTAELLAKLQVHAVPTNLPHSGCNKVYYGNQ